MLVLLCSAVALMEFLVKKVCEWRCEKLDCDENSWMLQQEVWIGDSMPASKICFCKEDPLAMSALIGRLCWRVSSSLWFLCQSAWCLQSAHFHWWFKDYQWKWLLKEGLLPYQKQAGYHCIVPVTSAPLSAMKTVPVLRSPFSFFVFFFAEQTFCHLSPLSQCWLQ